MTTNSPLSLRSLALRIAIRHLRDGSDLPKSLQKELTNWRKLEGRYRVKSIQTEVERLDGLPVSEEERNFGEQKTIKWLDKVMDYTDFPLVEGTQLKFSIQTYPEFSKLHCYLMMIEKNDKETYILTDFSFQKFSNYLDKPDCDADFFGEEFLDEDKLIDKRYTRRKYCKKCDIGDCLEDKNCDYNGGKFILYEDIHSLYLERNWFMVRYNLRGNLVWNCSEEFKFKDVFLKVVLTIKTDRLYYCRLRNEWHIACNWKE
jgi:hypothetical protein